MGNLWNISGYVIYKGCFDKISLNAASCQMAYSTVSVHTSKEPELKGLKSFLEFKTALTNKEIKILIIKFC